MEYQYKCRITAWDFFRLTMRQTYRSMAGMCNLVFTVAMILLTAKFWSQSGEVLQVLMLIAYCSRSSSRRQSMRKPGVRRRLYRRMSGLPLMKRGCSLQPEGRNSICRGTGCGLQNSRGWCWCFREPEAAIC